MSHLMKTMITWPMASKVADFGHVKQWVDWLEFFFFKKQRFDSGMQTRRSYKLAGDHHFLVFSPDRWRCYCLFATCFCVKYSSAGNRSCKWLRSVVFQFWFESQSWLSLWTSTFYDLLKTILMPASSFMYRNKNFGIDGSHPKS
jgi:hypothetical protein